MSDSLKQARHAARKEQLIKLFACFGAGILAGYFDGSSRSIFVFAVVAWLVWFLYTRLEKRKAYHAFCTLYRKEMIENALRGNGLFEEMQLSGETEMIADRINESGLLRTEKLTSDCLMQGSYRGISFIQADVRNLYSTHGGGYALGYEGIYAIIPTYLRDDIVQTNIADKKMRAAYLRCGNYYRSGTAAFDAAFRVYSDMADRAAELLTPEVMEKLLQVREHVPGKTALAVRNGRMYILMSDKHSALKPRLWKKPDETRLQDIAEEVMAVRYFMDVFGMGCREKQI